VTAIDDSLGEGSAARSSELHSLMVLWRKRLRRSEVPGLRPRRGVVTQEEMAWATGVSTSWYSALERGHLSQIFSDAFLDRVATTFRLSVSERRALFLLVTDREPKPRPYTPTDVTAAVRAVLDALPWPAFICDQAWNLVVANEATLAWLPGLREVRNLMRLVVCQPQWRHQLVDWEAVHVPRMLALLRAQLAKLPDDQAVQRLKADVLAVDVAAQVWEDPDRALVWMHEDDGDRRTFRLPGISNRVVVEIVSLTLQRNPNLRLTLLVPFDSTALHAAGPE